MHLVHFCNTMLIVNTSSNRCKSMKSRVGLTYLKAVEKLQVNRSLINFFFVLIFFLVLRYYGIFKVRKFESSFYKINKCLQKTTTCIRLQTEQIFSNFGCGFCSSFSMYFQKLQPLSNWRY